jgi:hypothetical protein
MVMLLPTPEQMHEPQHARVLAQLAVDYEDIEETRDALLYALYLMHRMPAQRPIPVLPPLHGYETLVPQRKIA